MKPIVIIIILYSLFNFVDADENINEKDNLNRTIPPSLPALRWSQNELTAISSILAGDTYFFKEATETIFKKKSQKAELIHIATHAIIDNAEPMFSRLLFTPAGKDDPDDGLLYAYELFNLKLKSKLVILSACNTGCGKLNRGEGIMSIARGFMYAGCPSIIMSLWQIDDQSTVDLMNTFYRQLAKKKSKDEALREAKLKYLENADAIKSNPLYWAGFISLGDPVPVKLVRKKCGYDIVIYIFIGICIMIGSGYFFFYRKNYLVRGNYKKFTGYLNSRKSG